jgi:hypothetical protein
MKVHLRELQELVQGLNSILEEKLPAKIAYWLARNADKLNQEMRAFEKTRINTLEKHATKDKNGKPVIKNNRYELKDTKDFDAEISKFLDEEIDIDLKTISLEALGDVKLKTIDMIRLQKIIKEDG